MWGRKETSFVVLFAICHYLPVSNLWMVGFILLSMCGDFFQLFCSLTNHLVLQAVMAAYQVVINICHMRGTWIRLVEFCMFPLTEFPQYYHSFTHHQKMIPLSLKYEFIPHSCLVMFSWGVVNKCLFTSKWQTKETVYLSLTWWTDKFLGPTYGDMG